MVSTVLRIIVELVPLENEQDKREIGRLEFFNVTAEPNWDNEYGDIAEYRVRGHRRTSGFWALLRQAVDEHSRNQSPVEPTDTGD